MYKRIMVPVDLAHLDHLQSALKTAEDIAGLYGAEIVYVSVTTEAPSALAHTPAEFGEKLAAFAQGRVERGGHKATSRSYATHDPSVDMDKTLRMAITDTGADLVVMATHKPGIADLFWGSHGGTLAAHAKISVFVVR
jgi:nucleotide-binding universal stress UspA family protein